MCVKLERAHTDTQTHTFAFKFRGSTLDVIFSQLMEVGRRGIHGHHVIHHVVEEPDNGFVHVTNPYQSLVERIAMVMIFKMEDVILIFPAYVCYFLH